MISIGDWKIKYCFSKILLIAFFISAVVLADEFLYLEHGSVCSPYNKTYSDNISIGYCNFSPQRFLSKLFFLFVTNVFLVGVLLMPYFYCKDKANKKIDLFKFKNTINDIFIIASALSTSVSIFLFVVIFTENPGSDYCKYLADFSYVKLEGGWCRPKLVEANVLFAILEVISFMISLPLSKLALLSLVK